MRAARPATRPSPASHWRAHRDRGGPARAVPHRGPGRVSPSSANPALPHHAFGIQEGLLTTIHSYTADQNLLDGPHKDLRRARSAAVNIIPTSTGAARAIGEVLPELAGKLDGVAVRVPVVDASLVDLTVRLSEPATPGQVNRAFATAADGPLKGILRCTTEPVVSHDVIGESASCLIDTELTRAVGDTVKVFGWYDNEWGYVQRTVDLVDLMARTLPSR